MDLSSVLNQKIITSLGLVFSLSSTVAAADFRDNLSGNIALEGQLFTKSVSLPSLPSSPFLLLPSFFSLPPFLSFYPLPSFFSLSPSIPSLPSSPFLSLPSLPLLLSPPFLLLPFLLLSPPRKYLPHNCYSYRTHNCH